MEDGKYFNIIFENFAGESIAISVEGKTTVQELIHLYFKRKGKENLIVNNLEILKFSFMKIIIKKYAHFLKKLIQKYWFFI